MPENENLSDGFHKINVDFVHGRRDKLLRYADKADYTWMNWCATNLFAFGLGFR